MQDDFDAAALVAGHDQVFLGEVLQGPLEPGFLGCAGAPIGSADPMEYEVEVIEAFAGVETGEVVTVTSARSGASCGVEMSEGETWLLMVSDGSVSLCDWNLPGDEADDELDALRELAAQ
jgi:hypothetical protein